MSMTSPMMDLSGSVATDDTFQSCDSPSGSSTSEPHEDPNQLPFIDQSFFYKLDQLSPDNPLYFMQQQQHQQQPQQQQLLQQQQVQQHMQQQQIQQQQQQQQQQQRQVQTTATTSPSVASTSSFVDPLLPSTPTQQNPTFWSGFNNNPIPNVAKNFTDYIGYTAQQQQQNTEVPGMQIRVLGVPQTGAKSRVETQIKLCIQLVTDDGDKAQWWSHLKLPEAMVAKDKLKRQVISNGIIDNSSSSIPPNKVLYLSARVICASDPSRKVVTCLGCIQRERKRSQRRKENRTKMDEDDANKKVDDKESLAIEEQKVLLFNCSEIVDFSSGDTILPTRITCYCRHHNERLGFCIYFEMHDHTGKQVATGISPPIMITDDHKSNKVKSSRKRLRADNDGPSPNNTLLPQISPQSISSSRFNGFNLQPQQPQTPYQIQPRPAVRHQSGTESPSTFSERGSSPLPMQPIQPIQPIQPERPVLQRLIPNEGPTFGGVEVTLLGSGFRQGLTCMFGDVAASSTHYWSPNTLVCVLPPAAEAGTVVVSFKEYPLVVDSQDVTLFTYYNENDRALMELALQVVGLKMTGKVEDAREIAMRIVQGGSNGSNNGNSNNNSNNNSPDGKQASTNNKNQNILERHIIQVLQVMSTFCQVDTDDISITSPQGHTMLHLACMLGFIDLTTFLIDMGCDVNKTDRNGFTPLHYAAWYNHTHVVKLMLNHGKADPEISNMWNKRPIHLTNDLQLRQLLWQHVPFDESDNYSTDDNMSADVDTSSDESESDDEDLVESDSESLQGESWQHQQSYLSDSSASSIEDHVYEGIRHRRRHLSRRNSNAVKPTASIQYLSQEDVTSHSTDDILDAEPVHENDQLTDYEENNNGPKEKTWMQRTLSHFQPNAATADDDNSSFLQNIKNTIPAKPSDLKGIADQFLQFPRPASMVSALFPNNKAEQEQPDLAWYMALAYAMGAGSLTNNSNEESAERSSSSSSSREEETIHSAKKRRDSRLYSFWVPMLCLMVIWLIYQFVSSHPGIVDSIIGISGFRRQYLTVH